MAISIRSAELNDADCLVAWAQAMALETEQKILPDTHIVPGIAAGLANPHLARYLVAEIDGVPAGTLMLTSEWSDWRNGLWLWIQSVYVAPEHRRKGVYRALYAYVQELKDRHLRKSLPLAKVAYDARLQVMKHALGTHTSISRVQGAKLKSKREIRVAMVFREMPPEFLRMIVVHELAHLREREHDKAFYQLCRHMEPDYHQLEFDLRAYLSYLAATGNRLWGTGQGIDETRAAL